MAYNDSGPNHGYGYGYGIIFKPGEAISHEATPTGTQNSYNDESIEEVKNETVWFRVKIVDISLGNTIYRENNENAKIYWSKSIQ